MVCSWISMGYSCTDSWYLLGIVTWLRDVVHYLLSGVEIFDSHDQKVAVCISPLVHYSTGKVFIQKYLLHWLICHSIS
jgi:hypothetical protein